MTERTYTFEMKCPRCGKEITATGTGNLPPPKINCGECLWKDVEIVELKATRVWVNKAALAILLAISLTLSPRAEAQQATVYGPDGRVTARTVTGSGGSTVTYGADGRAVARTTTSPSTGSTTVYDTSGRKAGSITPERTRR